jgi:NADH:ubiquinone oxidoreductase subunit D
MVTALHTTATLLGLQVRMHEMRESLRILFQCLNEMPEGPYKSIDGKASEVAACMLPSCSVSACLGLLLLVCWCRQGGICECRVLQT